MKKRKKKMKPNVAKYLAALKRRKSFGSMDAHEHEALRKYHGV